MRCCLLFCIFKQIFPIWIPELVRDWHDSDFPMSRARLAAAITPSLDVLRLRTNLCSAHTSVEKENEASWR